MLQKLPGDEGDEDGWNRASALFDTLRPDELLQWPAETLLTRLFHEEGVRLLGDKPPRFACSCSQGRVRSEEHTSELQSLMRLSYAVFCLKKNTIHNTCTHNQLQ